MSGHFFAPKKIVIKQHIFDGEQVRSIYVKTFNNNNSCNNYIIAEKNKTDIIIKLITILGFVLVAVGLFSPSDRHRRLHYEASIYADTPYIVGDA